MNFQKIIALLGSEADNLLQLSTNHPINLYLCNEINLA